MMPKESQPTGSPLRGCELDVDLKDYRPGREDVVFVEKNTPICDDPGRFPNFGIMFDPQTDLVTITTRREPETGCLPSPDLHWIVPGRHLLRKKLKSLPA